MRVLPAYVLVLISVIFSFTSCEQNISDKEAKYVRIDSLFWDLEFDEGTEEHKFTEVWAYLDGNYIGTFPLPATVPVLSEGETLLSFFPGIRNYGNVNHPNTHPFALRSDTIINFDDAPTFIDLKPSFKLNNTATLAYMENFELGNSFTYKYIDSLETGFVLNRDDAHDGNNSAKAVLSLENSVVFSGSSFPVNSHPINGNNILLEFSYKSDIIISVGISGRSTDGGNFASRILYLNPSEEWNRIYMPLEDFIQPSRIIEFRVFINAEYNYAVGGDEQEILIDEIKLIHF